MFELPIENDKHPNFELHVRILNEFFSSLAQRVKINDWLKMIDLGDRGGMQPEFHPIASSRFLLSATSESTSR